MLYKAHRPQSDRRCLYGFTLVELLVVISIIALLLSILLPSLKLAKDRAKEVVCASQLKQWGVAFGCYANDHRGLWPHCDGLDRGPDPIGDPHISEEDLADWHGWVDVLPPMIDRKPFREHPRFERPDEKTFFQCPFVKPDPGSGVYSYRPERDGYYSYAMNSCLELDLNAWPPPDGRGYPMPSFLSTTKIRTPQEVFVLFDQLLDPTKGFDARILYRSAGQHCGSYPKAFAARHRHGQTGLGGNILLADGHTEWHKSVWGDDWDVDQEVPPRDDPNWYPYPAPPTLASR
jgi:prepilin-type N-terminal cleavage/methylation domain-containing protein/prepilin-type processing-associated H-X9-DG protein